MATPPMTHEMMAAGPAVTRAFCAPKSQPEPMIDPTDAQSRPIRPISRFSETGRRVGCCSIETDIGHLPYAAPGRHTATPGPLVRPDPLTGLSRLDCASKRSAGEGDTLRDPRRCG